MGVAGSPVLIRGTPCRQGFHPSRRRWRGQLRHRIRSLRCVRRFHRKARCRLESPSSPLVQVSLRVFCNGNPRGCNGTCRGPGKRLAYSASRVQFLTIRQPGPAYDFTAQRQRHAWRSASINAERPGWAYVGSRGTTDESRCNGPTTSRRMNSAILYVCAIANDARQVQASL